MIRVVILQRRRLDRDALTALIRQSAGFSLVAALTSDWETVSVSKTKRPDVVILDTSLPHDGAVPVANSVLRNGYTKHVVFLGDEPAEAWETRASQIANSGYLTRHVSRDELLAYIGQHCSSNAALTKGRVNCQPHVGSNRSRSLRVDAAGLSKLSPREIEVFGLLVAGGTVRQCAEELHLSINTVDNHKMRIMKKLNVHKTVELVRLAIREGIIDP